MDVYLVPVAPDRHELYCEHVDLEPAPDDPSPTRTIRERITAIYRRALQEGEEARRTAGSAASHPHRGRVRRWVTSRLAEAVAEQRLLWRLRREPAAVLVYPAALSEERAWEIAKGSLRSDLDHRRLWCVIDTLLALVCAPFTIIPGPNLPAYYFVFRAVGHFLAMRGAQHGLSGIAWTYRASAPLATMYSAVALDADARASEVEHVGAQLGLSDLALFVEGSSGRRS
ncbi:MAG TPA: hypothetical protein VJN96_17375 [Vicinamibacterales bacterium]|nr:hypothetical protein [Vicinamibacterales bacterium]